MIPYGRQNISEEDITAVVDALRSDFLTQGPLVPRFEETISSYCGAKYAVATNSATSALHIACLALDVGSGDIVWTSPISFVASANCALYCGAEVDFVDIDIRTFNMSIELLSSKLEEAYKIGRLPKVVIPVHMCGQSCEMEAIHTLSKKYGFRVIEDASHAIGGSYQGNKIGNCLYSDITVFSFHPVKIITTGEGGMAVTNQIDLAKKMEQLRSHGITRDPLEMDATPDGAWTYQQINLGFNYRMTDIQAALGISQMNRLDDFVAKRHEIASRYGELLQGSQVITPWQIPDAYSSFHLYVVRIEGGMQKRKAVFDDLRESEIGVNIHYMPIYKQPYYAKWGFRAIDFPESEKYYAQALTLPLFPGLSIAEQTKIVESLRNFLDNYIG
jgi:UDP-4-amino-4,6-dideoxy-N-acetyl-beta-L-altrosamine transaminase